MARALRSLPRISTAMSKGELSFAQTRALTRVATRENESELLAFARDTTAAQLERTLRSMKVLSRKDEVERERERHRWRSFSVFPDGTGMYQVRGRLDPEVAAVLMRVIEAASDALYSSSTCGGEDEVEPQQRRADALGLVAERALAAGFGDVTVGAGHSGRSRDASAEARDVPTTANTCQSRNTSAATPNAPSSDEIGGVPNASAQKSRPPLSGSRAERYQVVVHVDADTLRSGVESDRSELADGTRLSPETARRLACDASVVNVTRDPDGSVLDVGRRTRTISPALRRALEVRDGGCRFPGCGSRFVEAHHIVHWADGGRTGLANCCLLCTFHHRLVHEEGYTLHFPLSGQPTFYTPRGLPVPDRPPRGPEATLEALVRANVRRGVLPDGWTCTARYKRDADIPLRLLARMFEAIEP